MVEIYRVLKIFLLSSSNLMPGISLWNKVVNLANTELDNENQNSGGSVKECFGNSGRKQYELETAVAVSLFCVSKEFKHNGDSRYLCSRLEQCSSPLSRSLL